MRSPQFYLLLLLLLLGGQHTTYSQGAEADTAPAFVLLQMNDVYEIAPVEGGRSGGLARVATLRKALLEKHPQLITVLAGDFISPSLFNYLLWQGERVQGAQMIDALNALGLDYVILGNHEYDLGADALQARMDQSTFDWIITNVQHKSPDGSRPFTCRGKAAPRWLSLPIPSETPPETKSEANSPYHLHLVGITLDNYSRDWTDVQPIDQAMQDWQAAHPQAAKRRPRTAQVALTHQSRTADSLFAQQYPYFDLIIGGHEHYNMHFLSGSTPIAKADANAKTVFVHSFFYEADTFRVHSQLVAIDSTLTEDPEVKAVVDTWMARARAGVRDMGYAPEEVLHHADTPLYGTEKAVRSRPTNLAQHIALSMLAAAPEAELAVLGGGSIRLDDDLNGAYTAYDVVRTLPFGGHLVEIEVSGKTLARILTAGRDNRGTGGYLQLATPRTRPGGYSPATLNADGQWLIEGKPLVAERTYRLVLNDYLTTGKERRLDFLHAGSPDILQGFPIVDEDDPRADVRLAFMRYLRSLP